MPMTRKNISSTSEVLIVLLSKGFFSWLRGITNALY